MLSMLRCTGTSADRYEFRYSSLDQMCPHQYKASPPRRAYIRRVHRESRSNTAIRTRTAQVLLRLVLVLRPLRPLQFSSRKAPTQIRQRNFWPFASSTGGCSGRVPFWPLGQRRSGRCQGDLKASSAITPNPCLCTDGVVVAGMLARLSSRLVPSHTSHRGRKRSQAGTNNDAGYPGGASCKATPVLTSKSQSVICGHLRHCPRPSSKTKSRPAG
ncbi:hypothetical protein V8C34DRAFT_85475 [Trichoderma compactum]